MTYKQETIKPYGEQGDKGWQVEHMFDRIAHSYDLLNHCLSLGIDRRWRRAAIDSLRPFAPRCILDVATGTGDFAIMAAKRLKPRSLLGVDISEGMLKVGRKKVLRADLADVVTFQREDCMALGLADNTFDALTVAYGIRNYEDLDRGLGEMLRVLKPGGRLVIIELTAPRRAPMKQLFWLCSCLSWAASSRATAVPIPTCPPRWKPFRRARRCRAFCGRLALPRCSSVASPSV